MDFVAANPNITLHLKFEDLFSKDTAVRQQTILQLLSFMGIELGEEEQAQYLNLLDKKKNNTKKVVYEGVDQWSSIEQENFSLLTKEMQEHIYGA